MARISVLAFLALLAGCADQSKGSALNQCRMKYFLDDASTQQQSIPECMKAKSFEWVAGCNPLPDGDGLDWQMTALPYSSPKCYRPVGTAPWMATALSPL
jgi:hypothetical protein